MSICIPKIKAVYQLARIYLFKVNNGNFKTSYEIWSKLIIKTPEDVTLTSF